MFSFPMHYNMSRDDGAVESDEEMGMWVEVDSHGNAFPTGRLESARVNQPLLSGGEGEHEETEDTGSDESGIEQLWWQGDLDEDARRERIYSINEDLQSWAAINTGKFKRALVEQLGAKFRLESGFFERIRTGAKTRASSGVCEHDRARRDALEEAAVAAGIPYVGCAMPTGERSSAIHLRLAWPTAGKDHQGEDLILREDIYTVGLLMDKGVLKDGSFYVRDQSELRMRDVAHDRLPIFSPDFARQSESFARHRPAKATWLAGMETCLGLSKQHDDEMLLDLASPRLILSCGRFSCDGAKHTYIRAGIDARPFVVTFEPPDIASLGICRDNVVRVEGVGVFVMGELRQLHFFLIHPSASAYARARPIARFLSYVGLDLALNLALDLAGNPVDVSRAALFSVRALPVQGAEMFANAGYAITSLLQAERMVGADSWTRFTLPAALLAWIESQGVDVDAWQVDSGRSWLSVMWGRCQSAIQMKRSPEDRANAACQAAETLGPAGRRASHVKRLQTANADPSVRQGWAEGGKLGGKVVSQLRIARGDLPHLDPRVAPLFNAAQGKGCKNRRGRQRVSLETYGTQALPLITVHEAFVSDSESGRVGQLMEESDVDTAVAIVNNAVRRSFPIDGCVSKFEVWQCKTKSILYLRLTSRRMADGAVVLRRATKSHHACPFCQAWFLSVAGRTATQSCRPVAACPAVIVTEKGKPDKEQYRGLPALVIAGIDDVYRHKSGDRPVDKNLVLDTGVNGRAKRFRKEQRLA